MSTTITNLPETSKVNDSDYLVLDQSDKTVKSTVSNFLTDTGVVLATQLKDTDGVKHIGGLSFVTPEMFKDSTDGSDGAMVLAAWTYVANNGGVLQLLPREYAMGKTRINFPYSETLKPHVIKGAGEKSVLKFGDIPPIWTRTYPKLDKGGSFNSICWGFRY